MRKAPPFDMEYVYSTYLLEAAEREGARVFNRPRAIRDYNEKLAIADFRDYIAPTLVTRDAALIGEFIDEHRDVIVKPLDGMGGTSVFRVRENDPNRNVIIETVSQFGDRTVMAQRFIPEIADGDKRILLIAGEAIAEQHQHLMRAFRHPGHGARDLGARLAKPPRDVGRERGRDREALAAKRGNDDAGIARPGCRNLTRRRAADQ